MSISFECNWCGRKLRAAEVQYGTQVTCPACRKMATVPTPDPQDGEDVLGAEWFNSDAAEDPELRAARRSARQQEARAREKLDLRKPSTDEDHSESRIGRFWGQLRKGGKAADGGAPKAAEAGEIFRFHWVFLAALIPLMLTIFWPHESLKDRVARLVQQHPELAPRLAQVHNLDELAQVFPGQRVPGALFSRDTYGHWAIGIFAACCYLGLLFFMFPGSGKRTRRLFFSGLFSGTVGILVLLIFQTLAAIPRGLPIRGRRLGFLIYLILQLIGYSYHCAQDPNIGFWGSFLGFTLGVGLCEELCKAVPIWYYLTRSRKTGWRGACVVGLASGIGFGVSEGIMYSGDMYNGIHGVQIYLVRFLSCVSLHAMWSGSVALMMYRNQDFLDADEWSVVLAGVFYYLWAAMLLHGLYDTLLKQNLGYVALLIGLGTYCWLSQLVAEARGT